VMAAAVADYHVVNAAARKIKRGEESIEIRLEPNPDILKELGEHKNGKVLIGFAAETDDLIANASRKLRDKNLDIIIANDVSREGSGFDVDTNAATILDRHGNAESLPVMSKDQLAHRIYDHFLALKRRG